MSISITGQASYSGSAFYFDTYNQKSYIGEPTTNLVQQQTNYTGTSYGAGNEWTSDPTRFVKTYDASLPTPIGFGATLCTESGSTGVHHLSGLGGSEESGAHSISCYVYPLSPITNFTIGLLGDGSSMVTFNFVTGTITYGGNISNRVAFMFPVLTHPGWYRIGANVEGRFGGWVGCLGINTNASYTPSAPYKSFYITGLQYEYKTHVTQYVFGTRSVTQGLLDLNRGVTMDLTNVSYNDSASIVLNGTSSYFNIGSHNLGNQFTICTWAKPTSISGDFVIVGTNANGCDNWLSIYNGYVHAFATEIIDVNNFGTTGNTLISANKWYHVCMTINTNTVKVYLNGKLDGSTVAGFNVGAWNGGFCVGRRCPDLGQRYFPGEVGSVLLHKAVLTDDQILKDFNRTKARYGY